MNAQYIAQSMGLQVYRKHEDVVAVFPLESDNNTLHGLVIAERELKRFGFVDRRFAASIESSWPRKKDKRETVLVILKQLQKKRKGAAFAPALQLLQACNAFVPTCRNCIMQDT